jgi:hypothetical protein
MAPPVGCDHTNGAMQPFPLIMEVAVTWGLDQQTTSLTTRQARA